MVRYSILFLLLTPSAFAATKYCDSAAAGGGEGSEGSPWTWAEAVAPGTSGPLTPGDTLRVKGTFDRKTLTRTNVKGTLAGGFITIEEWPGQTAIITSTEAGTAGLTFSATSSTINSCDSGWTSSAETATHITAVGDFLVGTGSVQATLSAERASGVKLIYANFSSVNCSSNSEISFKIRSSTNLTAGDLVLVVSEAADGAKSGSYLSISVPALQAGEWRDVKYEVSDATDYNAIVSVGLWTGATVASGTVITLDNICRGTYTDGYWKFKNIDFTVLQSDTSTINVKMNNVQNVYFEDCTFTGQERLVPDTGDYEPYCNSGQYLIYCYEGYPAANVTIDGCTFIYGYRHLEMGGADTWLVKNCTMSEVGEDNICVHHGARDCVFQDCIIHDCIMYRGEIHWAGTITGTLTKGDECFLDNDNDGSKDVGEPTLVFNRTSTYHYFFVTDEPDAYRNSLNGVHNLTKVVRQSAAPSTNYMTPSGAGDGNHTDQITISKSNDTMVQRSSFYNKNRGQCIKVDDTGGLPGTETIQNCLVYSTQTIGTYAVILYGATDIRLYNNTIIQSSSETFSHGLRILRNTAVLTMCNNIIDGGVDSAHQTITAKNNVWRQTQAQLDDDFEGTGSLYGQTFSSGMFVGYATQDYHLVSGSPAIDVASATYAPADDYDGMTRPSGAADDAGAFEYDSTAPVLAAIGAKSGVTGTAITFTASSTGCTGTETFSIDAVGTALGATINSGTGAFSWNSAVTGTYTIRVTVTDVGGSDLSDYEDVEFTIEAPPFVNHAPVLNPLGSISTTINLAIVIDSFATDEDGNTLTYSVTGLPVGLSISSSTGVITGTVAQPGTWIITVTVSDGTATDSETFTLTVYTGGAIYGIF